MIGEIFDLVGSLHREVQGQIDRKQNSHMYLMVIFLLSGKAIPYCSINHQVVTINDDILYS